MSTVADLPESVARALRVVAAGGSLFAVRTFPHPHRYKLTKADGTRYATEVPAIAVAELVARRLVAARTVDFPKCDTIEYPVTELGRQVAEAELGVVLA